MQRRQARQQLCGADEERERLLRLTGGLEAVALLQQTQRGGAHLRRKLRSARQRGPEAFPVRGSRQAGSLDLQAQPLGVLVQTGGRQGLRQPHCDLDIRPGCDERRDLVVQDRAGDITRAQQQPGESQAMFEAVRGELYRRMCRGGRVEAAGRRTAHSTVTLFARLRG